MAQSSANEYYSAKVRSLLRYDVSELKDKERVGVGSIGLWTSRCRTMAHEYRMELVLNAWEGRPEGRFRLASEMICFLVKASASAGGTEQREWITVLRCGAKITYIGGLQTQI